MSSPCLSWSTIARWAPRRPSGAGDATAPSHIALCAGPGHAQAHPLPQPVPPLSGPDGLAPTVRHLARDRDCAYDAVRLGPDVPDRQTAISIGCAAGHRRSTRRARRSRRETQRLRRRFAIPTATYDLEMDR